MNRPFLPGDEVWDQQKRVGKILSRDIIPRRFDEGFWSSATPSNCVWVKWEDGETSEINDCFLRLKRGYDMPT